MTRASRRPVLAVIGQAGPLEAPLQALGLELGRLAVDHGFRVVTGGLGGMMAAVSEGAHRASGWREGDVIGVVPSYDRTTANPWVDIVVPTGMQLGRNVLLVAMADVIVAIGGGAGTLSEMALAWQLGKPLVALVTGETKGGWATELAGRCIDARGDEPVHSAASATEAIELALRLVVRTRADRAQPDRPGERGEPSEPGEIGSGWRRRVP